MPESFDSICVLVAYRLLADPDCSRCKVEVWHVCCAHRMFSGMPCLGVNNVTPPAVRERLSEN